MFLFNYLLFKLKCVFLYKTLNMPKKEIKKISISLPTELLKKMEDGDYNKNKLITRLLKEYLNKNKK